MQVAGKDSLQQDTDCREKEFTVEYRMQGKEFTAGYSSGWWKGRGWQQNSTGCREKRAWSWKQVAGKRNFSGIQGNSLHTAGYRLQGNRFWNRIWKGRVRQQNSSGCGSIKSFKQDTGCRKKSLQQDTG
jgi:hypothetical protein